MDGYIVYELTQNDNGRVIVTRMASFRTQEDAAVYAKNRAFAEHKTELLVYPNGSVAVHSEKP